MVSPGSASTGLPSSSKVILVVMASALQLDLDERELVGVGVDDVVMHACLAEVGYTQFQVGEALLALRRYQLQAAIAGGHHHIVELVDVLPGLRTRGEAPLGHAHTFVVDLHCG